jgi:hypothetical protein
MKIYHYTKGISMNSIFTDGFIATESKRGINSVSKLTNCAWLTEKTQFPKTALPFVSTMPETDLFMHLNKSIYVDLNKLSQFTGGIYRFGFDSNESRFVKWKYSNERKAVENNIDWRRMESVANKVGDDVRSFWISPTDISLEKFSLDEFSDGGWKSLLTNCSLDSMTKDQADVIKKIKAISVSICNTYGLPIRQSLKAA